MSGNMTGTSLREWHVAQWPPLAWLETGIKLAAIAVGAVALIQALAEGAFALPSGLHLAQFVVLGLLSLGLVAAIFDRFVEREIVAMVLCDL